MRSWLSTFAGILIIGSVADCKADARPAPAQANNGAQSTSPGPLANALATSSEASDAKLSHATILVTGMR